LTTGELLIQLSRDGSPNNAKRLNSIPSTGGRRIKTRANFELNFNLFFSMVILGETKKPRHLGLHSADILTSLTTLNRVEYVVSFGCKVLFLVALKQHK
jgi:hypothetical protein